VAFIAELVNGVLRGPSSLVDCFSAFEDVSVGIKDDSSSVSTDDAEELFTASEFGDP